MNDIVFIDGDFPTNTPCPYHCSPTCHPAQTGPEWVYGCTHKSWPQNQAGDFVPIVNCGGIQSKCEIPEKLLRNMKNGLRRRILNKMKAIEQYEKEIVEIADLEKARKV